ncbi:hypothetical protein PVIIG_00819 [Plasmodium vivax India VII]|uniref:NFACT RNA-binding domain-containing protein n=5 Tax=Plasmodium vivax TaxID=5855 RepID=A5K018_PLAVS|nr:hypothetical protein, conserved [Plasmodium vivax]KMZ78132.1 hypothetical protein PVIIG_00819 [Plasmodium vivax India VII]KMZ84470.1 hypothetical protein PVBG_00250 [Plasmodium vivax Brazil I]KMZ90250.1 hypothetical protein PVMG_01617 [Plasmodium vivax Mauritania I]KMZ96961.1 hypothetical protein PVNG_01785 [Plasmodium vivax North Korean]EDL47579.1 hypothetical protein, conserved [Plasmodium vivax]|eukprot:XP_001617306.1 hypothetical protein [Plasmodium vivax Sal-1]
MFLLRIGKVLLFSTLFVSCVMNAWLVILSRRLFQQGRGQFNFIADSRAKYGVKGTFFFNRKRARRSELKRGEHELENGEGEKKERKDGGIFKYTKYDQTDEAYLRVLEKKANEIKNSKNCFDKRIKNVRAQGGGPYSEAPQGEAQSQRMDYTTLHLLAIELNALLQDCVVEHITQADLRTIVLHLNKKGEKDYYLYICYDNDNPVISLGLKIKKLFNRFIDDDYAQKLNPVLKYSLISDIYIKKSFIKILCIDFILKRKTDEDIDIEDILGNGGGGDLSNSGRKVTLLFDLHNNSCISFLINKVNNEILISPHNYVTEKVIDKSYKEGHIYNFPTNYECKMIPNEYDFFSSFSSLFKARKEQIFISSLLDLYEGLSYNMVLKFLAYLNIPRNAKFEEIDSGALLDFFNKAYIKWVRFLNLKEKDETLSFDPHFDYRLDVYSAVKFLKKEKGGGATPQDVCAAPTTLNNGKEGSVSEGNRTGDAVEGGQNEKSGRTTPGGVKNNNPLNKETHFETVIELVYYYHGRGLSVNKFYTVLKFCKEFIRKKIPQYEEMIKQYKNDQEVCERAYLLHENINKLSVFNHTISKMTDWIDNKTFDALKLIEKELKCNSLEDNRKKHVKKMEENKEKEELLKKKILNVEPNAIKSSQNLYKGSLLIKINETDLSSPFLIIGRNSKQNEKISTQLLKFNDLWFHVHEHPGGHVILRNKKINGQIITAELNLEDIKIDDDIKYAANMAAYFSKARKIEKTLVCFTFGKYVLKDNTLSEGAVELLKYRLVYGRPSKVYSIIKDLNERNKEMELSKKKK